jgi:sulfur transfer protein SufE
MPVRYYVLWTEIPSKANLFRSISLNNRKYFVYFEKELVKGLLFLLFHGYAGKTKN